MERNFNIAPLSGGYMLTSMIGFLISAFYVLPNSSTWGFTFLIFFALMFTSSIISMTYADFWPSKGNK